MGIVGVVNQIFSILTISNQFVALLIIILFLFSPGTVKKIFSFFVKHVLLLGFIVALTATLGSLFYSEVAGYEPCKLCWFERIFMYPQVFLLGIALWKKDRGVLIYGFVLSIIGALISAYHYLLQLGVSSVLPCSTVGYSAACSKRFVLQYGYITIPMMAFTAFLLIILLIISVKVYKNK